MPNSTGVLYGLNPGNYTEANLTRATVEGVTLGLNYGLNRMKELGINPSEIRLTGGASRNRVWAQICADIFDTEVVGFKESEGAALGAASQANASRMQPSPLLPKAPFALCPTSSPDAA